MWSLVRNQNRLRTMENGRGGYITVHNYEARANPADHKTNFLDAVNHTVS